MKEEEKLLWKKIETFKLDRIDEDLGFSIKLAYENNWSIKFTEDAILEYKKFMFLASVTNKMVSPSHIVDIVWHLHLTFTKSYKSFCEVLGKRIEHIPSTGKAIEKEVLRKAVEFTSNTYEKYFGERNEIIWTTKSFKDSIHIDEAGEKYQNVNVSQMILLGLILLLPVFYLWKPILLKIGNPDFIFIAVVALVLVIIGIEFIVDYVFKKVYQNLFKNEYIKKLHQYESYFFAENKIDKLVLNKFNNLFVKEVLEKSSDSVRGLSLLKKEKTNDIYENVLINAIMDSPSYDLGPLMQTIINKPAFVKFKNTAEIIKEKIFKSSAISEGKFLIAALLFIFYSFLLSRSILGIMRDKAVIILIAFIIASVMILYFYLSNVYVRKLKSIFLDFANDNNLETDEYLKGLINNKEVVLVGALSTLIVSNSLLGTSKKESSAWYSGCSSCSNCSSCSSCSSCGGCGD